jgi:hypothetical protein
VIVHSEFEVRQELLITAEGACRGAVGIWREYLGVWVVLLKMRKKNEARVFGADQ